MNALLKYKAYRLFIKNGDIILFRGSDLIDKAIQFADKAYFNHIGIVWKVGDRYLICDATGGRGVNIDFLSTRMKQEVDFEVIRVKTDDLAIKIALGNALKLGDEGYGYNYLFILQIALKNLLHIDFVKLSNKKAYICSKFVQYYTDQLVLKEYSSDVLITPQDYVRKRSNNIKIVIK